MSGAYKKIKIFPASFVLFILFVLISPWFFVLLNNRFLLDLGKISFISPQDQILIIDQVNILRGEMNNANAPPFVGRLLVNKVTFYLKEVTTRYLESFDPEYLFFVGDLDLRKSTRSSGPLYLAFLPLTLYGIWSMRKRKEFVAVLVFLLLSPIPASFLSVHFETVFRIPVFLALTILAAGGLVELFKNRRILAFILILFLLFETARFYHDFYTHYPRKLEQEILK